MVHDRRLAVHLSAGAAGQAAPGGTWRYLVLSLAVWAFIPELRRVIDWRIGFSPVPITAAVPLLVLLPFVVIAIRRWDHVPTPMRVVAWLWCGAFAYAFALGVLGADPAAAAYTFSGFVLPVFVGVWASSSAARPIDALEYFATAALAIAAVSSAYGLFQYVAPPPWDVAWMKAVGNVLGGYPIPYEVRVFGTLNSAGPFGEFVAAALILTLARRRFTPLDAVEIVICLLALSLSLVRTSWVMLGVGVLVYALASKRFMRVAGGVTAFAVLGTIVLVVLPAAIGAQHTGDVLVRRLSTLGDIGADQSANSRVRQMQSAGRDVEAEPLGRGLGVVGTATKLSSAAQATTVLDSGYLSRLVEMGFPGFFGYLAAIGIALALMLVPASSDAPTRRVCAAGAALQIALVFLDFGGESRAGFLGLFCWTSAGLALAARCHARRLADAPLAARIARTLGAAPLGRVS